MLTQLNPTAPKIIAKILKENPTNQELLIKTALVSQQVFSQESDPDGERAFATFDAFATMLSIVRASQELGLDAIAVYESFERHNVAISQELDTLHGVLKDLQTDL